MAPTRAADALRALHALIRLDGPADAQARADLAAWPGWGALAPAFAPAPAGSWVQVADELEEVLADHRDWLAAGAMATDTSFYTPRWLVDAMSEVLLRAGFTGGAVLEPGCGSGRFMGARLPGAVWTGVESDPVSAAIAAALHPGATIHAAPLEKVTFAEGAFDAAIGNVPFSRHAPFDPEVSAPNLHTYFILRSLLAVRPGGYVVVATSRHLLDDQRQTDAVLDLAELRSAVRLASGTFEATGAVADVLVLRRRGGPRVEGEWNDIAERADGPERSIGYYGGTYRTARRMLVRNETGETGYGKPLVEVNRFWETHPDLVAGTMVATGYDPAPLRVVANDPRGAGLAALDRAGAALPQIPPRPEPADPFAGLVLVDAEGRKEGSFHVVDDQVVQVCDGHLVVKERPAAELRALIDLRDKVTDLIEADAQCSHLRRDAADPNAGRRADALAAYEAYVARFGPLNRGTLHEGAQDPETGEPKLSWRRPAMGGFRRDPDYMTVMACEVFDPDTDAAAPAAILVRPVNRAPAPVTRVDTVGEALSVTLGERGRVDLTRIASLLGLRDETSAVDALGDLVFRDPGTDMWVPARDYLSGDVRSKLAIARAAADGDPAFQRNVDALAAVVPSDLGPTAIRATLGSPWISPRHVEAFAAQVLGVRPRIAYARAVGAWEVEGRWYGALSDMLAWGTSDRDPLQLLDAALNGRAVTIYDEVWNPQTRTTRRVRNAAATLAAEAKVAAMQERFGTWVWEDAERASELTAEFNRRFRSHVPRVADGSGLTFPGLADGFDLWRWQKDAVDRIVSQPRTLIGHPVGSGKTLEMVAAALTLRRLGLANKPMLAVPGHLLEQIAREAQQAFPAGRFLVAGKEDLDGEARRLFAARCATGDWDAVVVTHEVLTSLPVDPQAEAEWVQQEKWDLADAIRSDENRSSASRTAKAVAAAMKRLDARLAELRHAVADERMVRFEHLGVDWLGVDELHYFKRLPISSRAEGFSMGSSKRATDLMVKVSVLGHRRGERPHFAGFTGTVWSNSLAETYVWQRFFQPDALRKAGVDSFDAWAAMFVRYVTAVEVAPDGSGFRLNRRPVEITNVRVLMSMFRQVAALMTADQLNLPRPQARRHTVVSQMTAVQAQYVANLAQRADRIRAGKVDDDNMLVVCNDGRRVALDPHLLNLAGGAPKIDDVAANVASVYHSHADRAFASSPRRGACQLLLCDQGTPGPGGTQTYGRLKAALIARGVPAQMIRFAHEARTDKARAALFAACRDGSVAVLIGSTGKVGVGTNIQTRLAALHHVDVPWRPSDIEQREGRALRPKNLCEVVDVFRYVTEGSFDAYMWQANETKARFIHALQTADADVDTVGDIGAQVLSFGEVKALASGNPLLLEHATAVAEVRRLRTLRAMHIQQVSGLTRSADKDARTAESMRSQAKALADVPATVAQWTDQQHTDSAGEDRRVGDLLTRKVTASYGRPSATWRGLTVEVDEDLPDAPAIDLRITLRYRTVGHVSIRRKAVRRDATGAAKVALQTWLDGSDALSASLSQRAAALDASAAQARTVAAAAVFEHADALAAAESRLARIEEEMAAEAEEPMAA